MLRFVLQKLFNRRWMAVCLLIGNILLIAVTASNPIYTDAMLQKTLSKRLSETVARTESHPAVLDLRATIQKDNEQRLTSYQDAYAAHVALPDRLKVPVQLQVEEYSVSFSDGLHLGERSNGKKTRIAVGSLAGFQKHSELVTGVYPSDTVENGVIEAVLSEPMLEKLNLLVGESYQLSSVLQPDGVTPYQVKVVGVYHTKAGSELFWSDSSHSYLMLSEEAFETVFNADGTYPYGVSARCTIYLDYAKIFPHQTSNINDILSSVQTGSGLIVFKENLSGQLANFVPEAVRLKGTLTVLQAPIFALLAAFIFMVSKQMMELEENEIAVLKSRGSMRSQIIGLYALQSAILALVGFLVGYPLAFLICQMLGASNAFMEFVNRTALSVRITSESLLYAAVACAGAIMVMMLPVTRYSGITIVHHKQRKNSTGKAPWWQRTFIDVALLAVSIYSYYSFNEQQAFLAVQMDAGNPLDPLLYFSSSIFILGAALLGIRLVPLMYKLIFFIGKKWWKPSIYTAFLRVLRNTRNQSFVMIFLIMTIALGMYNTSSARSINSNGEAEIIYQNGADVVVKELWDSPEYLGEGSKPPQNPSFVGEITYIEPNFERYRGIEGATNVTKVYRNNDPDTISTWEIRPSEFAGYITVMGIESKRFGETATFDETLLDKHWYHYINALSQDPNGVILSSSFRDKGGYQIGDTFRYTLYDVTIQGNICGFVDYWPGFDKTSINSQGDAVDNHLIVANLALIQSQVGLIPYEVWLNMDGSTQGIYDFTKEWAKLYGTFHDTNADIIKLKNEAILQGTNGVLTSNFIIVLLLCSVGFLIYWILSIRSRELQFGIYRAMGMSMREILVMLAWEQLLISGSSVLIGVVAGSLVTKLFLPLIQLAYSGTKQVLPIRMVSEVGDSIRLFAVIGLMIAVCMAVLAWLISKIHIAQALKLGED